MKKNNTFFLLYCVFAIIAYVQYARYDKQYDLSYLQGYEDAQSGQQQVFAKPQLWDYFFKIENAAKPKGYTSGYNVGWVSKDADALLRARKEQRAIEHQTRESAAKNQAMLEALEQNLGGLQPPEPVGDGSTGSFEAQDVVGQLLPEEFFPIQRISSAWDEVDVWIKAASVDEVRKYVSCVQNCILFENLYMAIAKNDPAGEGILAELFFKKSSRAFNQAFIDAEIKRIQERLQRVRFESLTIVSEETKQLQ